jgi:peptidoglycan/xylan/chitin deacetylase (PgdA/CDA1 family)
MEFRKKITFITAFSVSAVILGVAVFFIWRGDGGVHTLFSGGHRWEVRKEEALSRLLASPVLLYHNIDGKGAFSIGLDTLRAHFELFSRDGVKVISFREFFSRLQNPRPFSGKVMIISFDDGFLSMYTKLLPLVKEFRYPVTLFVYVDNVYHRAKKNITWTQLRTMDREGISVESHTISHADLVRLEARNTPESRRQLFEEMYCSKRILELYLHRKIRYLAFPYGRYNLEVIELCRYAGYERVLSTDYGPNIVTRNNYCIRRQHIKNSYPLEKIKAFVK